ncbi:efflux transporter outer membrane subunit [Novosphingobium naphthalenivorans]|uniref:efflux transporter outer membrane subunit n=1 Tax=Novosphingobium naphthalenivorans TaxID=273168 RepID=UPI00082A7F2B|nr:efflux transporter outer membrane subunit [Novosphingobium naphthalenivorans]
MGTAMAGGMAMLLGGCSMAPHYDRPVAPVSAQYPRSAASSPEEGPVAADIAWQNMFTDPGLQRLIGLALENNRDLRVAALNIEKARAQYRIQRAALIPEVSATLSGTEQDQPANMTTLDSSYSLGVGVSSYELDLFGRVRSLKDEALQSYLSTVETRRATHISLIAEVATAYITLAADKDLQQLAQETLQSRQRSYTIQQKRFGAGTISMLELRQAEGELEDARSSALTADSQVDLDRNALELLAGTPLTDDMLPSGQRLTSMLGVRDIPAGLPSALLQNRPDILAAEHDLMAANADIGAARAAFFPSISLTGSIGRASTALDKLFDGGNSAWSFTPQINLPIFTGGRLKANLDVSKASRDIAVAQYEQAIQTAFREVSDALAQRRVMDARLTAQQRRSEALLASQNLTEKRYREKVSGYYEVLDAQRSAYAARQALIQTELARQTNLITLYKVLGGGWKSADAGADQAGPQAEQKL